MRLQIYCSCSNRNLRNTDYKTLFGPNKEKIMKKKISIFTGYRCYRREDTGSWLITELFDVFRNCYQHLSLQSMITMASYNVASKEAVLGNSDKGAKQVPCVVSTLLKDLYFTEKL